jgi:hypothetical protein
MRDEMFFICCQRIPMCHVLKRYKTSHKMKFHKYRQFYLLFSSDFSSHEASYYAEMVKSWLKSVDWEEYWLGHKYVPPLDFFKWKLDT